MSLYFTESGTPGAPSMIFLHGIGASGWMWYPQITTFADYHCLNVDLPGHGKSNHIAWVSLAETADQVAALIRERATNRHAHVVGLSLGGHIGLALLERHANVVDHAVISGVTAAPMPNRSLLGPQLWLMSSLLKKRWYVKMQAKALRVPPNLQACA